jgi:hypothetical protein
MKLSEIARYWAAKELTQIERRGNAVRLKAPFGAECFTVEITEPKGGTPLLTAAGKPVALRKIEKRAQFAPGTWLESEQKLTLCFDLPEGESAIEVRTA